MSSCSVSRNRVGSSPPRTWMWELRTAGSSGEKCWLSGRGRRRVGKGVWWEDVVADDGRQLGGEVLAVAQLVQAVGVGLHQVAVLLVEPLVSLGLLVEQVARGGGVGHEQELNGDAAGGVVEAEQGGVGGQVE